MGVAYDVFGNGKTALKVNYSKYLQPANNESNFIQANPGRDAAEHDRRGPGPTPTATTSPECELENSAANGECGPWQNRQLRQPVQHDPRQPGHDARVGQPAVRLAVRRGGAAGDHAAPLGGRRVQPPVVEQLLLHRQPGARTDPISIGSRSRRRRPPTRTHRCPPPDSRSRSSSGTATTRLARRATTARSSAISATRRTTGRGSTSRPTRA